MNFHIADSFTAALARLTGQEQKQAKTAAFDLQLNPAQPGLQMHRLTNGRDPNFWSVRVNQDIRIIIHKTEASFMLAYVDHHDDAYSWAERRRIEAHPRTGAIQIVEVHERIEILDPAFVVGEPREARPTEPAPAIFARLNDDQLLDIGTPEDWLGEIRGWTEEQFFERSEHLPAEVSEALLDYAASGRLPEPQRIELVSTPFDHPDTLRRVRLIESSEELRLALDFPWEKWSVFLHPSQREIVDRDFTGPARVTGTAGTGKTIVALHRAVRAVREEPQARVLLTSFSRPLANALRSKLRILLSGDVALLERVSVASFEDAAAELYQLATGRRAMIATDELEAAIVERALSDIGYADLPRRFVVGEWRQVIDAWGVVDQDAYTRVPRIGRRNRLGAKQRESLWPAFERVRFLLTGRGMMTLPQLYSAVHEIHAGQSSKPYTHVIVDEAQDLGVPELRMMASLANGPNALFFGGDLGQRIFQLPFSWTALGVDVRGRSKSLKVNYRMSRQIREASDKLLPPIVRDVDGGEDDRTGAQSVFEGPMPLMTEFADPESEKAHVAEFLKGARSDGIEPSEIGVFVRSTEQLARARQAIGAAGFTARQLSERPDDTKDCVSVGVMHFAKGLEFKAVVVMACDDDVLPLQSRVDGATNEDELREVFDTERSLFYVACTRARDRLLLSAVRPASEFFGDMGIALEQMAGPTKAS